MPCVGCGDLGRISDRLLVGCEGFVVSLMGHQYPVRRGIERGGGGREKGESKGECKGGGGGE